MKMSLLSPVMNHEGGKEAHDNAMMSCIYIYIHVAYFKVLYGVSCDLVNLSHNVDFPFVVESGDLLRHLNR